MLEEKLHAWESALSSFRLPEWENLPELELYMDQVVLLMSRYLSFPPPSSGEETEDKVQKVMEIMA